MALIEVGAVCIKTRGREAGKMVAIVGVKKEMVEIDGDGVRRRKCNPRHLFPIGKRIGIKSSASHGDIVKKLKEIKEGA